MDAAISTCISIHTQVRNIDDEALIHDRYPFVAMIYLLRNAETLSTVYVSVPFLTDMHIIDEMSFYAKHLLAGGRNLKTPIIIGPLDHIRAESLCQWFYT
jgi:hypothetical protein